MANGTRAKIYTPEELEKIRYKLPASWTRAIGILKNKKIDPVRYQKRIRKGWGKRLKKQGKLSRQKNGN